MKGFNSSFLITLIMSIAIILTAKVQLHSEQIATFEHAVLNRNVIQQEHLWKVAR
jgi:hypothetical protein